MPKYSKHILSAKRPRIPFTKIGYDKLLQQKEKLEKERPDAVKNLADARSMGDLSENGYYKAARSRLSSIDARLRRLERLARFAIIVESVDTDAVQIGSRVVVSDGENQSEYTIVGGYESDPAERTISYKSPLGHALIGKHEGDQIQIEVPAGIKRVTVVSVFAPGE